MQPLSAARSVLPAVACAGALLAVPVSAAPHSSADATVRVIVAPVTASGHPAAGYTVKAAPHHEIYCGSPSTSPVSTSPDVAECSPSAAYAVACWKSATPHQALCLQDPRRKVVIAARLMDKFGHNPAASKSQLSPFVMVLTDGSVCWIRDGGAWAPLKGHPNFYGTYSCSKHGVVWARYSAMHSGVNESMPSWTVRTGPPSGNGPLTTRHVARAYFVATATS